MNEAFIFRHLKLHFYGRRIDNMCVVMLDDFGRRKITRAA